MDISEIHELIKLMKEDGLAVFKLERENFRLTLKTADAFLHQVGSPSLPSHPYPHPPIPVPTIHKSAEAASTETVREEGGKKIVSPMVGTFYIAPSPDAPPFVEVGKQITPETVVCIVEAMKVMNEIKAEVSGTIVEIAAENGKPVQFGQVLFRVK